MGEQCMEPCAGLTRLEQHLTDLEKQNGIDHKELRERLGKVELTNAVQNERYDTILGRLDDLAHRHDTLVGKLEALETKPVKRWESFVGAAIGAIAAAIVALILAKFGVG